MPIEPLPPGGSWWGHGKIEGQYNPPVDGKPALAVIDINGIRITLDSADDWHDLAVVAAGIRDNLDELEEGNAQSMDG